MKKFFLLTTVLATGLFYASCSSDSEVIAEEPASATTGESFVKLAIQLPSAPSTRANDNYDDGEANEYAVKNATLVLFEGANEANATFQGKYDLNLAWNQNTDDAITTTAEIVQQVNNRQSSANKFFAYVVLNAPANFNAILTGATGKTFAQLFGTDFTLASSGLTETVSTSHYIPMTNAPLATYAGGASLNDNDEGQYSVLAEIDVDEIYSTEAEAAAHPATAVYVERLYAKTTLSAADGVLKDENNETLKNADDEAVGYTIVGWTLDNTNKTTYFQHQVETAWYNYHSDKATGTNQYRFKGSVPNGGKYRIYWATDPNYNEGIASMDEDGLAAYNAQFNHATTASTFADAAAPLYCYENTFSVADQKQNATTRALLKVEFNDGDDFFTLNSNYKTLYTAATLKQKIYELLAADATVEAALDFEVAPAQCTSTLTLTNPGQVTVSNVVLKNADGSKELPLSTPTLTAAVNAMFNNPSPAEHIRYYNGGIAYYPVLIHHFGDVETPWTAEDHLSSTAYSDEGTAPVSRYLGRYGMVRNNWYSLNVQCISNIGEPVIPEPGTGDDDTVNSYIAVQINVLSWAKREQTVKL